MIVDYPFLKSAHMALACVSVCGFVLRWWWKIKGSALSHHVLTRSLPHLVDTLLLGAGVALTVSISQYPLTHGWLSAKLLGLVLYIALGMMAMSGNRSQPSRTLAFCGALLVFGWIVSVARTKSVSGIFLWL
jgi:uncharacterized membrane protein SirB2